MQRMTNGSLRIFPVPVEALVDLYLQDMSSGSLEGHGEQVVNKEANGCVSNVPIFESHVDGYEICTALNSNNQSYLQTEISTNSSLGMIKELSLPFESEIHLKTRKQLTYHLLDIWHAVAAEAKLMLKESV